MRIALILAAFSASYAAGDSPCRDGFNYYQGWCVHTTYPRAMVYDDAVKECSNLGAYAPSIHDVDELDFWRNATTVLVKGANRFWLDAYCFNQGQPYKWLDGTATDYFGPAHELQSCSLGFGFHMHASGFVLNPYSTTAMALCAYNTPSTTTSTTPKPTTTEPIIDVTADYCSCNPNSIYLDIVFIVDTSDDMTSITLGDATATIKSTLYGLTFGSGPSQSNVAVVAFAETVQTVVDFGGFKSTKDINSLSIPHLGGGSGKMMEAIKQATSIIHSNGRDFTRGVIVLLSNSFNQRHSKNIEEVSNAFKDDGGVFITIDYSKGLGIHGLEDISSPGYYLNDTTSNPNLDADILYAFCDANCFCKDGLNPYNVANERGRDLPKGCFRASGFSAVYEAAKDNCEDEKGFVATVHDNDKSFFLMSLFPPKSRFWIGLRKNGNNFEWADGSNDKFTHWAAKNPIAGQDCAYAQQQTGFNSAWFSAPCVDPLKNAMRYACQLRPCGSDYDCWA